MEKFSKEAERLKIYQGVFNERTLKILTILASKGFFKSLDFPISTGKEADVYRATAKEGFVAIKIYRIETSNFKRMKKYLIGDPRFKRVKKSRRAIVNLWCQKEYRNLREADAAGILVPKPVKFLENVLIMEFIGEAGSPASLLKDFKPKNFKKIIKMFINYVKKLFKAGLVHGDLSEFNVMILHEKPYVFDMSQAVSVKHPLALELLQRDLQNISRLARKYGIKFEWEKEFEKIKGLK